MKYLMFFAAVLAILPLTIAVLCERAWLRWLMLGLLLPGLAFNATAINFFSHELYRGTARGMEVSIIYIVAFIVLLSLTLCRKVSSLLPDWGSRLYVLYFLLSLPSLYQADNKLFSFFELWKMCMIYMVYLATYHYLKFSRGDFDIFLTGLLIIVGVNFQAIVAQHFFGVYQVRGTFPHQNSLAMYMQLTGMLFFARYFNRGISWRNRLFFCGFCLASATLFRTYSRGAIACYPIAGVMTLILSLWYKFSSRKILISGGLALIGIIGVSIFLPRVIERFTNAPEASGQTRKNLAVAAFNMIKDQPITGVGINNWGIRINPPYNYSQHRETMRYSDEHPDGIVETIYLLVGAECGLPCMAALLAWFAYYWVSAFRLLSPMRGSK